MTTRYKSERIAGNDKRHSVGTALAASIPSIIVSGMGLFAATFGVAVYSDIDIISSMLCVIFILPSLLMLCDKLICATTFGMKKKGKLPPKGPNAPKDPTVPNETISQKFEMQV